MPEPFGSLLDQIYRPVSAMLADDAYDGVQRYRT
jgi:hypothetical protein